MSLLRFHRETAQAMRMGEPETVDQRVLEGQQTVRDRWLESGEHRALVCAVTGNWTSGNCVEFMLPLSRVLIARGEPELHRHLWTRTIKRQVATFFREYSHLRSEKPGLDELLSADTAGFDEFDFDSSLGHRVAAAFFLKRLMSSLHCWKEELSLAGFSTLEPDGIAESIQVLKVPKITVPKLAP